MKISRYLTCWLCFLWTAAAANAAPVERSLVKIGLIIPLSGEVAAWGVDAQRMRSFMQDDFNRRQDRYRFEIVLEDGKCGHGNAAMTAAKKLVSADGVRFIVAGCSGEILQIGRFVETEHVVAIAFCAGNAAIKDLGDYVFRTYLDLGRGMERLTVVMRQRGDLPLAILTEENAFTLGNKKMLQQTLGEAVVFAEDYAAGDADLRTLILKAKAKRPRAYFLNAATPQSFIILLQQLRLLNVSEQLYAYYNPGDRSVQQALGSGLDGILYLDVPDVEHTAPDYQTLLTLMRKRYPDAPTTPFLSRTAYDALRAIFDGIMTVGPDPLRVKDFLYGYEAPGATGTVRFDRNGDIATLNFVVRTIRNGMSEVLTD